MIAHLFVHRKPALSFYIDSAKAANPRAGPVVAARRLLRWKDSICLLTEVAERKAQLHVASAALLANLCLCAVEI